jgi:hypothetical protein
MCDYSLSGVANRQAVEGERLITYRFPNGVKGFVSQPDLVQFMAGHGTFWKRMRAWFRSETPCAVCLPPGAKLVLRDVPESLRTASGRDNDEIVEFTQSGSQYEYRDGVQFSSGTRILLQQLPPGLEADVLNLKPTASRELIKNVVA